jgi:hypothetical protein
MNDFITDVRIYFRQRILHRYFLVKHTYKVATIGVGFISAFLYYLNNDYNKIEAKRPEYVNSVYGDKNTTYKTKNFIVYNADSKPEINK